MFQSRSVENKKKKYWGDATLFERLVNNKNKFSFFRLLTTTYDNFFFSLFTVVKNRKSGKNRVRKRKINDLKKKKIRHPSALMKTFSKSNFQISLIKFIKTSTINFCKIFKNSKNLNAPYLLIKIIIYFNGRKKASSKFGIKSFFNFVSKSTQKFQ